MSRNEKLTTEAEEAADYLLGGHVEDDAYDTRLAHSVNMKRHRVNRSRLLLTMLLCIVEAAQIGLYISTVHKPSNTASHSNSLVESYQLLSIFSERRLFRGNSTFQEAPVDKQDDLWRGMLPRSAGVVSLPARFVQEAELPRSMMNPDDEGHYVYRIGVYHQIHCLDMIRRRIWNGKVNDNDSGELSDMHIAHCIEYLRTSLTCSSDLTLLTTGDLMEFGASAQDLHRCRNYEAITEWADTNRWHNYYHALSQAHPEMFPPVEV